jgi:DNA-binding CsgD family transcriptional regulator
MTSLIAVASASSSARPLVLADAQLDLAELVDPEDRVAILESALTRYVDCGAIADARAVRKRLHDLGSRRRPRRPVRPPTGWDALTASELNVVRQVARGLTNQAVADELVVSPHTVSSHLRSSFRKLGVCSRVHLTRIVLDHERGLAVPA